MNVVTRSGTNAFHGTVFNFFRNGDMNATNYFSSSHDTLKRNQFGGTIGGPIVKNKLFFFGGYQGTQTRQQTNDITVIIPNQAILNGDWTAWTTKTLPAPFVGNKINPALYNASAVALATKYLPTSTAANGKYVYGPSNPQSENQYIGRIDWNKSEKETIFGRYYITHFNQHGFFNNNLLMTANAPAQ